MSWTPGLDYPAQLQASSQSPTGLQHVQPSPQTPNSVQNPRKRKKSDGNGAEDDQQQLQRGKHQPVKRACNECRQQKLRCDVQTEPELQPCSRCVKHHLHCAIDPGFRRQEKRQQHAEIEKEVSALKAENAELRAALGRGPASTTSRPATYSTGSFNTPPGPTAAFPGPNEAAASRSLLDLAHGFDGSAFSPNTRDPTLHTLGRVTLSDKEITDLFSIFFAHYHPYLPLLSTEIPYTAFFNLSPLLHWAIIAVASRRYSTRSTLLVELQQPVAELLWSTVSGVPQTYHIVKALCLLCAWPLPTSSTSVDPSMMICGTMVQLAMQFGLHRPSHAQDFSRYRIELREEDIRDRMNTWVAVNLMAQNISTGYGMPQISRWNWYTHGLHLDRISATFHNRCLIERFNDKITRTLYTMQRDEVIKVDEAQRALTIDMFAREYEELEIIIRSKNATPIEILYLHCAALHLRLTAFFDAPTAPDYRSDLSALYVAASTLLKTFLALPGQISSIQTATTDPALAEGAGSAYATNYVMQMILAAGFTLLKLLNSFFATQVDVVTGRTLFLQTVSALRSISVVQNDLPQRLAEVLAQLWQANGGGSQRLFEEGESKRVDSSLQLKVRCRMSMSLVYDSVWRWREEFGAHKNLDRAVEHPTQPDGGAVGLGGNGMGQDNVGGVGGGLDMGLPGGMEDWVGGYGADPGFDSLGWFLDLPNLGGDGFVT